LGLVVIIGDVDDGDLCNLGHVETDTGLELLVVGQSHKEPRWDVLALVGVA
jgi:hypothetical protein